VVESRKFALQVDALLTVTLVDAVVPAQLPDQPVKTEPVFAAAFKVMLLPAM